MRFCALRGGGHRRPSNIVGIYHRKSTRDGEQWRDVISDVVRFNDERCIVVELERIAGAKFLSAEKSPVAGADNRARPELPGKSNARSEVIFVRGDQATRCAILSRENQFPGGEIQVGYLVVDVVEGGGIVIAKAQVKGQFRVQLEIILNESAINLLAVVEGSAERDIGTIGQSQNRI